MFHVLETPSYMFNSLLLLSQNSHEDVELPVFVENRGCIYSLIAAIYVYIVRPIFSKQCVMAIIRVGGLREGVVFACTPNNKEMVMLNCCFVLGLQLPICYCLYSSRHKVIYQLTFNIKRLH